MSDDPRMLREVVDHASWLATNEALHSVFVGLSAREGDLSFPEFIAYCRAGLRMEDRIISLTRDRTVLYLADIDEAGASAVCGRLQAEFERDFPMPTRMEFVLHRFSLTPENAPVTVRSILTSIFPGPVSS
jgi:hypothetical protein